MTKWTLPDGSGAGKQKVRDPRSGGGRADAFTNSLAPAASYLEGALQGSAESRAPLHKLFLKGARCFTGPSHRSQSMFSAVDSGSIS